MRHFRAYFKECGGPERHNFAPESGTCCMFVKSTHTWHAPGGLRDAAESVYAQMNAGHRKNGQIERSLSVGDLLTCPTQDGDAWFLVDRFGMRGLIGPPGRLIDHPHSQGQCPTGECATACVAPLPTKPAAVASQTA